MSCTQKYTAQPAIDGSMTINWNGHETQVDQVDRAPPEHFPDHVLIEQPDGRLVWWKLAPG
jgi:hypothetical protein